jgi:hypothetical protein
MKGKEDESWLFLSLSLSTNEQLFLEAAEYEGFKEIERCR